MFMRRRQNNNKSRASHERWLITYADMITLLLVFFIVMFAISKIDANKFQSLAASMARAMGTGDMIMVSPGPSFVPGESAISSDEFFELEQLEDTRRQLQALAIEHGVSDRITITSEQRGIVLSFQEDVLFPSGSAKLTPTARELIDKVTPILLETNNYLRVEGHTDDVPIRTSSFPSNWELSVARATSVLQQLLNNEVFPPQRLSAVGYGEYRPRVPNDSPDNRQLNRRVDIVILRDRYKGAEAGAITTQ